MTVSTGEQLRASLGALVGILLTGGATWWLMGDAASLPVLIAPIGASALLLFAVPASPLAQPWSIIGGNFLAAIIGVTCAMFIRNVLLAAPLQWVYR